MHNSELRGGGSLPLGYNGFAISAYPLYRGFAPVPPKCCIKIDIRKF